MNLISIDSPEEKERILKIINSTQITYWTSGRNDGHFVWSSTGQSLLYTSPRCIAVTGYDLKFNLEEFKCKYEKLSICFRENKNLTVDDYDC